MFACFFCALLGFCVCEFPEKYEKTPGHLSLTEDCIHIHGCSTRLAIVSDCLSLYLTISNNPVVESIIVKYFSMLGV